MRRLRRGGARQEAGRRVFLIALIAAAGLVFAVQAAQGAGSAQGSATAAASDSAISISIDDGRVTLYAPAARLDHVLHRIGAEAGFNVIIKGDIGTSSPNAVMTRVPLELALRRLFDGTSSLMVIQYEPRRDGSTERIAKVFFHARPPPPRDARP